jgi:hypothetical protein
MALYYVACKISLVSACKARRKQKYYETKQKFDCDRGDETNWTDGEVSIRFEGGGDLSCLGKVL